MHSPGAFLAIAYLSCGGRIEAASDADVPVDGGTTPPVVAVGDAGLVCTPSVSVSGAAANECTFASSCTGGLRVDGNCEGDVCDVHCSMNGSQTDSFTVLGVSNSCDDPYALAELAGGCPH